MEPPARRRAAARAHGAAWDNLVCAYAAAHGYLAVLQWARANGAPWEEQTCVRAARGGHLALLQWSRLLAGERLHVPTALRGTGAYASTHWNTDTTRY